MRKIGERDFPRETIRKLARRGIQIVSTTALPDESGSFLNAQRGYVLDDDGQCRVRTYHDVLEIAG